MRISLLIIVSVLMSLSFGCEGDSIKTNCEINVKQGMNDIPSVSGLFDFGLANYGFFNPKVTFDIENLGTGNLKLTGEPKIEVLGTDAAMFVVNDTATISPVPEESSTEFAITFAPTSAGKKSATISIASNDNDENPYTFTVAGECQTQQPEIEVTNNGLIIPCSTGVYDFGDLAVGFDKSKSFYIKNIGIDTLYLTGNPNVEVTGADSEMFEITYSHVPFSLNPNEFSSFYVEFKPTSLGSKSATISIANNDPNNNPYTFTVKGVGINPTSELYLRLNNVYVPNSSTASLGHISTATSYVDAQFRIYSAGTDDLKLTGSPKIQLSGPDAAMFTIDESNTAIIIDYNDSTNFTIRFTPTSVGPKYAKIAILSNDPNNNPYEVDIVATSSTFGLGDAVGWIGGGSNGWKTTNGTITDQDSQSFNYPLGICLDSYGNVYVADTENHRVSKWDSNGNALGWIGGGSNGWKTSTAPTVGGTDFQSFTNPFNVFVDNNGFVYVTDSYNFRVCKWDKNGNAIGWIGGGSDGWKTTNAPTTHGLDYQSFHQPYGVFVDPSGNIFISDNGYSRICKWDSNGKAIGCIGEGSNGWKTSNASGSYNSSSYHSFNNPTGITVDSAGNIYVADSENHRVCKWDSSGTAIGWIGGGSDGWKTSNYSSYGSRYFRYFYQPLGIAVDSAGNIFVAEYYSCRISLWDKDGNAMGWIGGGQTGWQTSYASYNSNDLRSFNRPGSVTLDSNGNIFVADTVNSRICKWRN